MTLEEPSLLPLTFVTLHTNIFILAYHNIQRHDNNLEKLGLHFGNPFGVNAKSPSLIL